MTSIDDLAQAAADFVSSVFHPSPSAVPVQPVVAPVPLYTHPLVPPAPDGVHQPAISKSVPATPPASAIIPHSGTWAVDAVCASIVQNEGGYVNNPLDRGHETKFGITLAFAKPHPDYFDIDKDGVVTAADIKAMPEANARRAYADLLFAPYHLLDVPNVSNIMVQVCDMSMNGPAQAIKTFQHAIGVKVDGVLGKSTLDAATAAVKLHGAKYVNNAIVAARLHFYDLVVAAHPTDKVFLTGWRRRANKYLDN